MSAVTTRREGQVLIVTLDRPKANAIDVATSMELFAAFRELDEDPALRVGIVTGTGRFFSAGWDLNAANEGEAVDAVHSPGGFAGLTEYFSLTKPVIAAVNGLAVGGGFELALAADLIVASEAAQFWLPEAQLGILPDSGGLLRLPKCLPERLAAEMIYTGRRLSAAEALHHGLASRLCPPETLLDSALELARAVAASAPLAITAARDILRATAGLDAKDGYRLMRSGALPSYQAMLESEDALEGPRAFGEGRPPIWQNR
ncbi:MULTISPECIES: enoyl-CoA hydratase-related protein [unclassified Novosphingobium]|uniref:enoyl-CoA hydratase-related protein n=1 Tax=unclassified Novosphingobium TaxID=2644732 RepID=UPI0025F1AEC5|nr:MULTISPECIES: enoyl-CoA hydratase-related protein [unclassified Novosphingobium]HQV02179.1 enoyl-CoA hydratase-related protein [Novosphingobium sp.]